METPARTRKKDGTLALSHPKKIIHLGRLFALLLAVLLLALPGYARKKTKPASAKPPVAKPVHFKNHKSKNGVRAHPATKHPQMNKSSGKKIKVRKK